MIILLAALATIGNPDVTPTVRRDAQAKVTIVRGTEISPRTWKPGVQPAQREIVRTEKDGRTTLIRVTEFQ
ncbi:MAG: hypothetical protein V4696_02055 [Pseudomonadota bacterium]